MLCRICETEEVPATWSFVAWCDACLVKALKLRERQPHLTLSAVVRKLKVARERGGEE